MTTRRKRDVPIYPSQPAHAALLTKEQISEHLRDVREVPDPLGSGVRLAKVRGQQIHLVCGCTVFVREGREAPLECPAHPSRAASAG